MASQEKKAILNTEDEEEEKTKCCPQVNRKLLVPKFYYFFFFSAWGSLLPYLALYFKQLMLSPSEVGFLMGLKPFVNFLVIPIWGAIVDKCQKSKVVLIVSMVALIISTFALCLVDGPQEKRIIVKRYCNMTSVTHSDFINVHRPVIDNPDIELTGTEVDKMVDMSRESYLSFFYKGQSPWSLSLLVNLDQTGEPIVQTTIDSTQCFITLFLITFFGTLISAPTLALVDTATLQLLGKETHKYGMQRLTGSVGWGVGAFVVGASLKTTHTCGKDKDYEIVDYIPCFYSFAILMFLGLVTATRFTFHEKAKSARGGSLRVGLRALKSSRYLMFLFTALYLGFLMAFIKTFLFWHLKDLGGSQLLFSIISAVNCFAEVSMYFLSAKLIKRIGHARVLYLGLICYSVRLFYYSVIRAPWLVLVVELLPGITTAAVWAACLSYVSINSGPGAATTMQCILHGVHWGLGYGAGEVVGGIMVHHYGAPMTFVIFGVLCLVILAMYILINYLCKSQDETDGCSERNCTDSEDSTDAPADRAVKENEKEKDEGKE